MAATRTTLPNGTRSTSAGSAVAIRRPTALAAAFGRRERDCGWTMTVEQEDVCPVATLPQGASIDDWLGTLGKKERHEIRRKVRRAEAVGEIRLDDSADPVADLPAFIDLHQRRWGDLGLFPDTPGGDQSRVFARRLFELFGSAGPVRLAFLTVGGRRIAAGITFETPESIYYYNAGVDPDARELSPGRADGRALHAPRPRARDRPDRLPARQRALQVRVGRGRRANPAGARSTNGQPMTPSGGYNPCLAPVRRSAARRPERIRVVQVLATGTNGGAQEHVYNLVSRMDRERYEVSVVSLSPGSAVRKLERLGIPVSVIDEPDDAIATGILAAHLIDVRADVVHNHMYRAEIVGTKAVIALGEAGHRRPWVISTVHSSRVRSGEDQEELQRLTPSINHLIVVSNAIDRKVVAEGRTAAPRTLIYNGIDLVRYDHQEPCCTLRDEYGMEPTSPIVGVVGRLELEKGHPTLLEAWPLVLEACPSAYLLIVGEGSRLDALHDIARAQGIERHVVFTGRRDDIPAVTAAFDVAVLPSYREAQGLTILEAMALSRPVVASNVGGIPEMIEDGVTGLLVPPQDPPALAAAIVRVLNDHQLADVLGRAGHDLVHDRFCVELMVSAVQGLYDEGAAAVRPREITPAAGRPSAAAI